MKHTKGVWGNQQRTPMVLRIFTPWTGAQLRAKFVFSEGRWRCGPMHCTSNIIYVWPCLTTATFFQILLENYHFLQNFRSAKYANEHLFIGVRCLAVKINTFSDVLKMCVSVWLQVGLQVRGLFPSPITYVSPPRVPTPCYKSCHQALLLQLTVDSKCLKSLQDCYCLLLL